MPRYFGIDLLGRIAVPLSALSTIALFESGVRFRLRPFVSASDFSSFLRFSVVMEVWVYSLFSCSGLRRLSTVYYALC